MAKTKATKTSRFFGVSWIEKRQRWLSQVRSAKFQRWCETEAEAAAHYNAVVYQMGAAGPKGKDGEPRFNNLWDIRPLNCDYITSDGRQWRRIEIDQKAFAIVNFENDLYLKLKDLDWFLLNGTPVVIQDATKEAPWRFEYLPMGDVVLGEPADYLNGDPLDCRACNLVPKGQLPKIPKKPFSPSFPLRDFTPSKRDLSPLERRFARQLEEYNQWQEGFRRGEPQSGIEPTNPWLDPRYRDIIS